MENSRDERGRFLKGRKFTDKEKERLSERRKKEYEEGIRVGYWKGKKFSKEHIEKFSQSLRGIKKPPLSEERKQKIKNIVKDAWKNPEVREKMLINRKYFVDKEHWNWKGGITRITRKVRNSKKYSNWRLEILKGDNFICQICGIRGGKLEADHIKKFSDIISENNITTFMEAMNCRELWKINNGRTLCRKCHLTTTNYGKRKQTIQV